MFRKPTVFIVGAGASHEAGFPLGAQLRDNIAGCIKPKRGRGFWQLSDDHFDLLFRQLGGPGVMSRALSAANALAPTMVGQASVDDALNYFAEEPDVIDLGKKAITYQILLAENRNPLNARTSALQRDSWLWDFFTLAIASARRSDAKTLFADVTVINFNYDRSLEAYLRRAFEEHGNLTESEAEDAVRGLKIIRPYGIAGILPWMAAQGHGIPFGSNDPRSPVELHHVLVASTGIRTFAERFETGDLKQEIETAVRGADLIVVLGCALHPQNLDLLQLKKGDPVSAKVIGSVFGFHEETHQLLKVRLSKSLSASPRNISLYAMKAHQLLTELRPLIEI